MRTGYGLVVMSPSIQQVSLPELDGVHCMRRPFEYLDSYPSYMSWASQ